MRTTKEILTVLAVMTLGMTSLNAQVGIGTATPHSSAILDLTNGSGKGLVLPKPIAAPSSLNDTTLGLIYYYSSGLYMKQSGGFNNLSAWKYKFNGSPAEDVTFNPAGMKGVGIGINTGSVLAYLHVSDAGQQVTGTGISAAMVIGTVASSPMMLIDADEILVRSTTNTGGTLKLQEEHGSLQVGSSTSSLTENANIYMNTNIGSTTGSRELTVHGDVNAQNGKIQEKGYELIPAGTIIAFYGTSTPKGWAPCDGSMYSLNASGVAVVDVINGAQTPNLVGRTIVGTGTGYTYNVAGGSKTAQLDVANLPDHLHSGYTKTDGSHSHTGLRANLVDNDDNDDTFCAIGYSCGSDPSGPQTDGSVGSGGSQHRHQFDTADQSCPSCTRTPFNIESPYLPLRYIMKL